MPNVMQLMLDAHLNAFGAQLLCESLLKSPIAAQLRDRAEPLRIDFPVRRSDCPGWLGVEITLRPIADDGCEPFYVTRNSESRAVSVKAAALFEQQGGLTEAWGKAWTVLRAKSIEEARSLAEGLLP